MKKPKPRKVNPETLERQLSELAIRNQHKNWRNKVLALCEEGPVYKQRVVLETTGFFPELIPKLSAVSYTVGRNGEPRLFRMSNKVLDIEKWRVVG